MAESFPCRLSMSSLLSWHQHNIVHFTIMTYDSSHILATLLAWFYSPVVVLDDDINQLPAPWEMPMQCCERCGLVETLRENDSICWLWEVFIGGRGLTSPMSHDVFINRWESTWHHMSQNMMTCQHLPCCLFSTVSTQLVKMLYLHKGMEYLHKSCRYIFPGMYHKLSCNICVGVIQN